MIGVVCRGTCSLPTRVHKVVHRPGISFFESHVQNDKKSSDMYLEYPNYLFCPCPCPCPVFFYGHGDKKK